MRRERRRPLLCRLHSASEVRDHSNDARFQDETSRNRSMEPENAMSTQESSAKQQVLAVYPGASWHEESKWWNAGIYVSNAFPRIGGGATEAEAWADAASRLEPLKEPGEGSGSAERCYATFCANVKILPLPTYQCELQVGHADDHYAEYGDGTYRYRWLDAHDSPGLPNVITAVAERNPNFTPRESHVDVEGERKVSISDALEALLALAVIGEIPARDTIQRYYRLLLASQAEAVKPPAVVELPEETRCAKSCGR